MATLDPETLWFNTPDTETLCRLGGNGVNHPSQLYAIRKYIPRIPENNYRSWSLLDYGCGSGTTLEALEKDGWDIEQPWGWKGDILYQGVDIIPKNIRWCGMQWPRRKWEVNLSLHKIDQPDKSWDIVYSRHVVDHMESFEKALDEHKRVAKKLVIIVLWTGLIDGDEHQIKNIVDHRGTPEEKIYPNEYTNNYSRKLVKQYLESDPEWELLELNEDVGGNQVIVLRRKDGS